LPDSYTIVPTVTLKKEKFGFSTTSLSAACANAEGQLKDAIKTENSWLQQAIEVLSQIELETRDMIGCAAYQASQDCASTSCSTYTAYASLL